MVIQDFVFHVKIALLPVLQGQFFLFSDLMKTTKNQKVFICFLHISVLHHSTIKKTDPSPFGQVSLSNLP